MGCKKLLNNGSTVIGRIQRCYSREHGNEGVSIFGIHFLGHVGSVGMQKLVRRQSRGTHTLTVHVACPSISLVKG
jgi:hypothetical protein